MSRRLVVIGDTLLDRDVFGTSRRTSPDAPAPVVDVASVADRAGGAGLAAALAVDEEWSVTLLTRLGGDEAGTRAAEWLRGKGVRVRSLPRPAATVGKTRVVVDGRVMLRLDDRAHLLGGPGGVGATSATDATGSTALLEPESDLDGLVTTCDAVLVSDYGGGVTSDPGVRSALARQVGRRPVVWDPHPRGSAPLPGCSVVTPNRSEAELFSGRAGDSLASVARDLRFRWGVEAVSVTDGGRGVTTWVRGHGSLHTAAPAISGRVDPCGAGDRFAGRLARGLGAGLDLSSALRAAAADVSRWLERDSRALPRPLRDDGQPSLLAAMDRLEQVRAHGGTVVATGGCFDVLHAGHLALLEAAAGLGDALVVLLNSDASVWRRKGGDRPVNSVADRARLLQALRMVDAVVVFDEDDPRRALATLRPDVWVKGGDYRPTDLVEAEVVERLGGRVEIVQFADGFSTTAILERVAQGSGPSDRP